MLSVTDTENRGTGDLAARPAGWEGDTPCGPVCLFLGEPGFLFPGGGERFKRPHKKGSEAPTSNDSCQATLYELSWEEPEHQD